jgi:5-methylcytosine-specific restriction endonuclease McrA
MVDARTRQTVRERAGERCEYCHLPQALTPFITFHIEHIEATQHVRDDSIGNLALACPDCNRYKGPNLTTLDLRTRKIVPLFHPRRDVWTEHFEYSGPRLISKTEVGEATIHLLQINAAERLEYRSKLVEHGQSALFF